MIKIDPNKCIGCGLCASDCLPTAIVMKNEKPVVRDEICIKCSHCVSVCPVGAVEMTDHNKDEVVEYDKLTFDIDPLNMLNTIKFRRSIRRFKDKNVEKEKLLNILEAGRYSPTASNKQATRYIVLNKELEDIKVMAMKGLHDLAVNHGDKEPMKSSTFYKKKFEEMYDKYIENGVDMLFYNAPMAILVVVDESQSGKFSIVDGALASANMEMMAHTQGLGMCHIGFFIRAVDFVPKLREKLELKEGEAIATTLILGYPEVKYRRGANRKAINVTMK